LSDDERQESLNELYEFESRRGIQEIELESYKLKACQKAIDGIDLTTYRLIREIKENQIEETVPSIRITQAFDSRVISFRR